jgi:anthranilate 1,2-dioxygenase large subunit
MNVNVTPGSIPNAPQPMEWPQDALTRIPYWIYHSPEIYALEQQRIYEGPVWNFLCLEAEVANAGDRRARLRR